MKSRDASLPLSSHLGAIFPRPPLEPFHPPSPFLFPLQHHALPLNHDGSSPLCVLAKDQVGCPWPNLWTAAVKVLLLHPQLDGSALLHVPHLVRPSEGGVKARLELHVLARRSDLPADADQEDVVLPAVLPHVHLPRHSRAVGTGGPLVPLLSIVPVGGRVARGGVSRGD